MLAREANALPVARKIAGPRATAALVPLHGGHMSGDSTPRLLLIRCAAVSPEDINTAAQCAGLTAAVESVANRPELQEAFLRGSPSVVIAGAESTSELDWHEVLDRARHAEPPVPVVVVGSKAAESESLRLVREGATEYLEATSLERLPSVLARALRVRESSTVQVRTQVELDRAVEVLRDSQKLITVGRLAASIAHEINNPLEAVTNLLYLLSEEKDLSSGARGYVALAQREMMRVAQIARQTLNFSRETTGPVRTHIDSLMEEVLSLYSRKITEKELRVVREYRCPEEATVYPGEMRQVLSNLLTNAVEALSTGGRLRIRVRCARSWSDPGVRGIRISVGDNGTGIVPAVQRRLGEPFFTTKGQRGTGLGLWVTRSIVERYGGEMQLRSSIAPARHGTVFSILLPTNLRPRMVERSAAPVENTSSSPKVQTFDRSSSSVDHASRANPRRRLRGL
jgi:two-component system, NtrC family, sensor kinase